VLQNLTLAKVAEVFGWSAEVEKMRKSQAILIKYMHISSMI